MLRKGILVILLLFSTVFTYQANGKDRLFRWKMVTDPYRNYIYPQQTGLLYQLSYRYMTESKSLRRYLLKNFDVRASPSVARIMKDVSTGEYFERYFECKVKHLKYTDTLLVKIIYENGDTLVEKYAGGNGTLRLKLHLTRYKQQHDFSTGFSKNEKKRGLITSVDMSVLRKRRNKDHVLILTKIYTEADMPGILSRINGKDIFR